MGVSSSVIPDVTDQLAMRRLPRPTYALMVSLLPATATVIGVLVLAQVPSSAELGGVAGVIAAVAIHRVPSAAPVEPDAEVIAVERQAGSTRSSVSASGTTSGSSAAGSPS